MGTRQTWRIGIAREKATGRREVTREEAETLALDKGMDYIEVSAKTGRCVGKVSSHVER